MVKTYGKNVIKKLTKKEDIKVIKPTATAKSYKPKAGKFIILSSYGFLLEPLPPPKVKAITKIIIIPTFHCLFHRFL